MKHQFLKFITITLLLCSCSNIKQPVNDNIGTKNSIKEAAEGKKSKLLKKSYGIKEMKLFGKVKSMNEMCYFVVQKFDGYEKGKLASSVNQEFDFNGNTLKMVEYTSSDDKTVTKINKYDYLNRLTQELEIESDVEVTNHCYQYNSNNKLTKRIWYLPDGKIYLYTDYTYDNPGMYSEEITYLKPGAEFYLDTKIKYSYNDKGDTINRTTYHSNYVAVAKYKYDDRGNLIEEARSSGSSLQDQNNNNVYYYKYDQNNNLIETGGYGVKIFRFDQNDNKIEEIDYDLDGMISKITRFEYDYSVGYNENVTKETVLDGNDNLVSEIICAYDYSENANWLRKKYYENNVLIRIIEREITYW